MKSSLSLQKHKRIGFKRPVMTVHVEEITDQETEEEKEINDIDSNSISSPEELQASSPILTMLPSKKQKSVSFEFPANLENEKTIPEPPSDLFECSFNWITENKFEFQQDSECDDLYFTNVDFTSIF